MVAYDGVPVGVDVELAALFLAMGIIGGVLGGLSVNEVAEGFIEGARDIVGAALIVGFAAGIIVTAEGAVWRAVPRFAKTWDAGSVMKGIRWEQVRSD